MPQLAERGLDAAYAVRAVAVGGFGAFRRSGGEIKAAFVLGAGLMLLVLLPGKAVSNDPPPLRTAISALNQRVPPPPAPYMYAPWKPVPARLVAYGLDAPELGRTPPIYRIRTLPDGSRQDVMVFAADATTPRELTGLVSIEHYVSGPPAAETFFVEIARRAAIAGASIERMAQTATMDAKFGQFETAEAQLDRKSVV